MNFSRPNTGPPSFVPDEPGRLAVAARFVPDIGWVGDTNGGRLRRLIIGALHSTPSQMNEWAAVSSLLQIHGLQLVEGQADNHQLPAYRGLILKDSFRR